MPSAKYIKLRIDGRQLDLKNPEDIPVSISYRLEDPSNFQSKKSSSALSIVVPATTVNDRIANTFHNPAIEDLTPGQTYRSFRNALIEANGYELLVGKALLTNASHTDRPQSYEFDFYGNNADWIIPLQESTLYDFLKHISFLYTNEVIEDSWEYDGMDEDLPYVFAPVRYGTPFERYPQNLIMINPPFIDEYNVRTSDMKPSISVYWLLYFGFRSLGYRIQSDFFDTEYFRRAVMPWTWGNFLFFDSSRADNLDFLAKSSQRFWIYGDDIEDYIDCHVDNELSDGAFDNNGAYEYDAVNFEMKWTYLPAFNYGPLNARFHLSAFMEGRVTADSSVRVWARWFKNDVQVLEELLLDKEAAMITIGPGPYTELVDKYQTFKVEPGDIISVKIFARIHDSDWGTASLKMTIDAFELESLSIPLGGTIDFELIDSLKKYKFLDFVAGVLDAFNISPVTDSINKVVLMEPMFPYSLTNNLSQPSGGYLNGNFLDWNDKQDLSKQSDLPLFKDGKREQLFKFRDDTSDGLLKKVQDRNSSIAGLGKYVLPDRFKAGKEEIENRFFSPVIHCEMNQWKAFGSDDDLSPQMVCLVPENISNTSRSEAQNTFAPKLCWYKGLVDTVGWKFNAASLSNYPYMFAVNYQPGGQNDPIFSYCDELIGLEGEEVIGKGLLRRFFLQRLANMRNGQDYLTQFRLNNLDVSNWYHREFIECRGQKWILVEINDYLPLKEQSTKCYLRKWSPVTTDDVNNLYPSADSTTGSAPSGQFDMKYTKLKCLKSDIPKIE